MKTQKPRIVIIDDDLDDHYLAIKAIDSIGMSIDIEVIVDASDIDRIVEITSEPNTESLILLDINMPVIDGISLLKIIRSRIPHVPIWMYTTSSSTADIKQSIDYGAEKVITKPSTLAEARSTLIPAIATWLSRHNTK